MNIVVTWMDGLQETYRCKEWKVENGNLWLIPDSFEGGPGRCIPLASVRIWTVD